MEIWQNRNMANRGIWGKGLGIYGKMGIWHIWEYGKYGKMAKMARMGIGQYGSMGIWPLAADGSISEASLSRQPVCH